MRRSPESTLIVADGFSCREQIEQASGRRAFHLAQLFQMGRLKGPHGPRSRESERRYARVDLPVPWSRRIRDGALLAAGLGLAFAALRRGRRA